MKILVVLLLSLNATTFAATSSSIPKTCENSVVRSFDPNFQPMDMVNAFREQGFTELTKIAGERGLEFRAPTRAVKTNPWVHVVQVSKNNPPILEYAHLSADERLSQFAIARALFNIELRARLRDKPAGVRKFGMSFRASKNRDHRLQLVNALLAEMYSYVMTLDTNTIRRVLPARDPGRNFKVLRALIFGGPKTMAANVSDFENIFSLPDIGPNLLKGTINERYGRALGTGAWRDELLAKAPQVLVTAMVASAIGAGFAHAHAVHYEAAMQMQPTDMVSGGVAAGYNPADPGYQRVKYHFLKARRRLDLAYSARSKEDFDPYFGWSNQAKVAKHKEIAGEIEAARRELDRIVDEHPRIIADAKLKAEYNRP